MFSYLKVNGMVSQEVTTFPIELSTAALEAIEAVEAETVQEWVLNSLRQLNCIQSLLKTLQRIRSFSMDWRSLLCTKSCFRWVEKNWSSYLQILHLLPILSTQNQSSFQHILRKHHIFFQLECHRFYHIFKVRNELMHFWCSLLLGHWGHLKKVDASKIQILAMIFFSLTSIFIINNLWFNE